MRLGHKPPTPKPGDAWNRVGSGEGVDFLNFAEARAIAKRRLPRGIFEYIDRGAEDERALDANRSAFDRVRIKPFALRTRTDRTTKVTLFGQDYTAPLIATPTACTGLVRYRGEIELARAAAEFGIPYTAATEAITAVEEIAKVSPAPIWFQLYLWEQEAISHQLMSKAWDRGVRTLLVTVDTPVMPKREFNVRNGFDIPFRFSARNVWDVAQRPGWALSVFGRYLLNEGLPTYANYPPPYRQNLLKTGDAPKLSYMPNLDWSHIARLREVWKGNLVVKGLLRAEDAAKAKSLGADGIVVSNHGGRNFDSAISPIEVLPEIVTAVGSDFTVLADSSVRRGSDVFKLLASGAKAVMLGRSMLWGTACGGTPGALHMMRILADELALSMDMSGCASIADISPDLLRRD